MKRANLKIKGISIALGGKYAVINLKFIHASGYSAHPIKKFIEKIYKWPLWWLTYKGYKKMKPASWVKEVRSYS